MRKLVFLLLLLYAGVATYFAWQYFHEPALKSCLLDPSSKLLSHDLPAALDRISMMSDDVTLASGSSEEVVEGIQDKLVQTTERAQKLAILTQQLVTELDLKNAAEATVADGVNADQQQQTWKTKLTDLGQYLYCRRMVDKYEINHQNITQILSE